MCALAAAAADTLPSWTPAAALPDQHGLLCWADPVGTIGWDGAPAAAHTPTLWGPRPPEVSWDAVWWSDRGTRLEVRLLSRLPEHRHALAPTRAHTPLMPVADLICDPTVVWDAALARTDPAEQLLGIVGAAWLLMQQPTVATRQTLTPPPRRNQAVRVTPPPAVTLIDLRRSPHPTDPDHDPGGGRAYTRRWWVTGHWRQQAVGPGRTQRRPTWIAPHVKGPADMPLIDPDRVTVWRR